MEVFYIRLVNPLLKQAEKGGEYSADGPGLTPVFGDEPAEFGGDPRQGNTI